MAAQEIKTLKLSIFTEIYSLTNEKKYDVDNLTQRHLLYTQFVAWKMQWVKCSSTYRLHEQSHISRAPRRGHVLCCDKWRQSLFRFESKLRLRQRSRKLERNDSKINLHITLKTAAKYKLRVRIWAYCLSEYLHVLSKYGLTLKHRTYTINQSDEDFLVHWGEKRKRRQKGGAIPIGLLASTGALILGQVAKSILKKKYLVQVREDED